MPSVSMNRVVIKPKAQIRAIKYDRQDRRQFIGGSDAHIIMGNDLGKLTRLWREKRGEIEPDDQSENLIVQLGMITEGLNRAWYQRVSRQRISKIHKNARHAVHRWMGATLDGIVEETGALFKAEFMPPSTFTKEAAATRHMAQLQHNMWVVAARSSVLSIITGDGRWVEIKVHADPLYQHLLLTAEKKFWRCVQTSEPPAVFDLEIPKPQPECIEVVDMASSISWAALACEYLRTREAHGEHELAQAGLKKLVPETAKEATGCGITAKRSVSGEIEFETQKLETGDAAIQ